MVALLFLLFLISSQIQSQKLTTDENKLNSKKCGVHFLGQSIQRNRLVKKSYGGREFEENEYPWTVVLRYDQTTCSGVQISPRHILTAAHCVLIFDEMSPVFIVSVLVTPEKESVFIGGGKDHCSNLICQNKTLYRAKKIITKELDICHNYNNDLALVELERDISESDSTPICMPEDDLPLNPVLYASGLGIDPSSLITFDNPKGLHSHGQQVVALRYDAIDQSLHQIRTKTFGKGILPGDSGGPLFQVNEEGRHILVGITSCFNTTAESNENIINYFTAVQDNLDWICKYSGVCPVEENVDWRNSGNPQFTNR